MRLKTKILIVLAVVATTIQMPVYAAEISGETESKVIEVGASNVSNKTEYEVIEEKEYYDVLYTADNVNIRTEPNTESEILETVARNTQVNIIEQRDDGWTAILYNEGIAFVFSDYLFPEMIKNTYTEEELTIMAHLLAGECQSYPDEEQLYVGSVVLNRVSDGRYPDSIKSVVFQKGQYACTWDGNYYREPTDRNWANAQWLLENGSVFPEYVIYQSGGKQGKGVYLKTKWHYYCY